MEKRKQVPRLRLPPDRIAITGPQARFARDDTKAGSEGLGSEGVRERGTRGQGMRERENRERENREGGSKGSEGERERGQESITCRAKTRRSDRLFSEECRAWAWWD